MLVRDIMTSAPVVIEVNERMREVRAKLIDSDIRHLPVVDRGRLVGIVSARDMPAEMIDPTSAEGNDQGDQLVSRFMSSDVLSVEPESDLGESIDLMIEHRIGALPVVDAESEELVGIVSYVDVLRAARRVL